MLVMITSDLSSLSSEMSRSRASAGTGIIHCFP
jgi:hypothetical protein